MTDLQRHFATFLDEFAADQPIAATNIGDHRFDGRWPDVSPAGEAATLALIDRWLAAFRGLDAASLDADDAIDRDLIVSELEAERFAHTELQEQRWDPLSWVYVLGDGLFTLIAREFAPLADRLTSVAERLEGLPAFLADAATAIGPTDDGRPVARLQTETAIAQLPGVLELIDDALAEAERGRERGRCRGGRPAAEAGRGGRGREGRRRHLHGPPPRHRPARGRRARAGWVATCSPASSCHTMRSDALTPERIIDEAERAVRRGPGRDAAPGPRRLGRMATRRGRCPTTATTSSAAALDAIAAEHPAADDLLDYCRAENARIEAFCREHDLIGLADEPLDIRWTPVFLRAVRRARCSSPPGRWTRV